MSDAQRTNTYLPIQKLRKLCPMPSTHSLQYHAGHVLCMSIHVIDQAKGSVWSIAFFSILLTMITPEYAPLTVVLGYAQCPSHDNHQAMPLNHNHQAMPCSRLHTVSTSTFHTNFIRLPITPGTGCNHPNSAISACQILFHWTNASAYLSRNLTPNIWHYSHPSMHSLARVLYSGPSTRQTLSSSSIYLSMVPSHITL